MFVVIRSFRDPNGFVATGSIVEPDSITRFKSRVRYGNIIEVTEQNFDRYANFFKERHGVDIELDAKPVKRKNARKKPEPVIVEEIVVEAAPAEEAPAEEAPAEEAPAEEAPAEEAPAEEAPAEEAPAEEAPAEEAPAEEAPAEPETPEITPVKPVEIKKVVATAK